MGFLELPDEWRDLERAFDEFYEKEKPAMPSEKWRERELSKIQPDWLPLKTPRYQAEFVMEFKREIPAHSRAWHGGDRLWYVHPAYIETAQKLARRFFYVRNGVSWLRAWRILHLQRNAPACLIEAAGICLGENHPEDQLKIATAVEILLTL